MIAIVVGALCVMAAHNSLAASGKTASKQQIAHGEYLVKVIGQCGDCHTPMNEKGEYVPGKWLQGTKLTFASTVPVPNWADTSAQHRRVGRLGPREGDPVLHDRTCA